MKKLWIIGVVILVLFGISLPSMKPSGPAPDTTAPHTTAPIITGEDTTASSPDITTAETTVPDTTAQETTNPETNVPDTTESATTPAPETTVAPDTTKTPETTTPPEDTTAAPHVHRFSRWYETKKTTCTDAGEAKRICACGESETKAIPAKGHTEVEVPGRDATCAKTGLTDGKKCSVCDIVIVSQKTIPLKEHIIVKIPGKPATCTEKGLTDGKECSLCGKVTVKQKDIAAKGHTEVKVSGKAATCTEKGLTDGKKCSICGTVTAKQTSIPATGHSEVTIKGKAATCTDKGLTDGKKCSVCNTVTVKQTAIPAKGHTEKTLAAKAATCTESGLTEGKQCSVCKTITVAQKTVAAKGHTWNNGTVSGNTKTYKCTVCKTTKTETISTCSHSYGPWQWEAYTFEQYTGDAWFDDFYGPATYTSHRKVRVCSKCGYRDVEDYGDHICGLGSPNVTSKVLCDNCVDGKDTYYVCGICGWNYTKHEESVNHEHVERFHTYIDQTECTEMTHQIKTTCLDCGSVSYSYPIRPTCEHVYNPSIGITDVYVSIPNAYNPNPDPEGINWMIVYTNEKYDSDGYVTSFDIHWHDKDQNCKVATIVVADVKDAFIEWGYTFPEGSRRGVEIALYDGYYIPMRQTGTS